MVLAMQLADIEVRDKIKDYFIYYYFFTYYWTHMFFSQILELHKIDQLFIRPQGLLSLLFFHYPHHNSQTNSQLLETPIAYTEIIKCQPSSYMSNVGFCKQVGHETFVDKVVTQVLDVLNRVVSQTPSTFFVCANFSCVRTCATYQRQYIRLEVWSLTSLNLFPCGDVGVYAQDETTDKFAMPVTENS